jgi:hypothetical protein
MKALTVRLEDDPALELEMVARIDGVAVAEVIRRAIAMYVQHRRADPEFSRRRGHLLKALGRRLSDPPPTLPTSPEGSP